MIDARRQVTATSFPPMEQPDWDHARTRHLALRVPMAEWCQSVLTRRELDGYYYLATDYAYEGLLALLNGENWKVVDRIGFQVLVAGAAVELVPEPVSATPDWALYRYGSPQGALTVRYQLFAAETGVLSITYAWSGPAAELRLKPLFDLRHMFYFSDPDGHQLGRKETRLVTLANHRQVAIATSHDVALHADRQTWDLHYRLGSGDREAVSGEVRFKREAFRGVTLGHLSLPLDPDVRVAIAAGLTEDQAVTAARYVQAEHEALARAQEGAYAAIAEALPDAPGEVVARLYVMADKFGIPLEGCRVPEVGGWWFRTAWLRPLFSGLLHNYRTLGRLGRAGRIRDALQLALRYQDPQTGRLPNRLPDHAADLAHFERTGRLPSDFYQAADPVLAVFVLLSELPCYLEEPSLAQDLHALFQRTLEAMEAPSHRCAPTLAPTGLLMTVPHYSWLNGKRRLSVDGLEVSDLPIRVDRQWQIEAIQHYQDGHYAHEQYQQSAFYLPEVNAQWIRMLEVGLSLADLVGDAPLGMRVRGLYDRAIANYKRLFWNSGVGFLYNLITKEGRPDPMVTSPGIEAAALLGSRVFTRQELAAVWSAVRSHLLVTRRRQGRPAAFGVLAKDSAERVFFGDEQYHEAVCWPRETPHLLRLLQELGEDAALAELLATNLGHQVEEGVVFYASEILSLPEGGNPAPGLDTGLDPVPVKNPMQWASLWCDPYLARA